MALISCNECGCEVSDKATICPKCGAPIHTTDSNDGKITFVWDGYKSLISATVHLTANNQFIADFDYTKPFTKSISIPSSTVTVYAKVWINTTKNVLTLDVNKSYTCKLTKSFGGIGFELYDGHNNCISKDTLSLWMGILCAIIPIFGIIYWLMNRDTRPTVAKHPLIISAVMIFNR